MVDIGQVDQSVLDTYGPRIEGPYGMDFAKNVKVTKADKLYDINFAALAQMEPPASLTEGEEDVLATASFALFFGRGTGGADSERVGADGAVTISPGKALFAVAALLPETSEVTPPGR